MRPITYSALAFAPILAGILVVYLTNRYNRNFGYLLMKSFFAGMLGVIVLILTLLIAHSLKLDEVRTLKRTLFYTFFIVGLSSELGKFIVFRYYVIPHSEIDRPIHAITFSVMTSLGFTSISMILFFTNFYEMQDLYKTGFYPFLIVPANLIFAVIMGFFVGMSRFLSVRFFYSIIGLFGAAFFHGLFKFCLVVHDFKLLSLFAFGSTLIVLVLVIKAAFTKPDILV